MDEGKQVILRMKYARIIEAMSRFAGISREEAMDLFYNSDTMQLVQDGVADLHCRSDLYLAEEVLREIATRKDRPGARQ